MCVNNPPTLTSLTKLGDAGAVVTFSVADFIGHFSDVDGDYLTKIKISSCPSNGHLQVNNAAVILNQEIILADLANLVFVSSGVWSGRTSFSWRGYDGADYSANNATVNLIIIPTKDTSTLPTLGGALGGVGALALAGVGLAAGIYYCRKKRANEAQTEIEMASQKVWHSDWHLKPSQSMVENYQLIQAEKVDCRKVVEYYQRCPVPGMDLRSVEVIYNPNLEQGFDYKIRLLQQRENNPAFVAKWMQESHANLRRRIINRLAVMTKLYNDEESPTVKLLPVWYGVETSALDSIFKTGYANLAMTDEGFFGKGLYSAYEAKYAYQIYSGGTLLVNWVSFYSAYPVVEGDMLKLQNKGNYANYDAHFVPVRPTSDNPEVNSFYPCTSIQEAVYHEMVVFDSAQCLPRYLVRLQPSLPKSMPLSGKEAAAAAAAAEPPKFLETSSLASAEVFTKVASTTQAPGSVSELPADPSGYLAGLSSAALKGHHAYRTVGQAKPWMQDSGAVVDSGAQPLVEVSGKEKSSMKMSGSKAMFFAPASGQVAPGAPYAGSSVDSQAYF